MTLSEKPSALASELLDPRVIAELQGLELRARSIVEGYVAGLHRSPYRGFSNEFAEHRAYTPGDDLRYVDWKVFGKSDKFYLKQFDEETNLICYLLVDCSESMGYRSAGAAMSKLDYAKTAAAALAYLVLHQRDAVGLVTFDAEIRQVIRPSSSAAQLTRVLKTLEQSEASGKTSAGRILHELAERLPKRGIVIALSDLFDDLDSMLAGFQHLRHRRHDILALQVFDSAEIDFPFQHTTMFQGLEALGDIVADPQSLRHAYIAEVRRFIDQLRTACRSRQIDYEMVRTDQPFGQVLSAFLAARKKRLH